MSQNTDLHKAFLSTHKKLFKRFKELLSTIADFENIIEVDITTALDIYRAEIVHLQNTYQTNFPSEYLDRKIAQLLNLHQYLTDIWTHQ